MYFEASWIATLVPYDITLNTKLFYSYFLHWLLLSALAQIQLQTGDVTSKCGKPK